MKRMPHYDLIEEFNSVTSILLCNISLCKQRDKADWCERRQYFMRKGFEFRFNSSTFLAIRSKLSSKRNYFIKCQAETVWNRTASILSKSSWFFVLPNQISDSYLCCKNMWCLPWPPRSPDPNPLDFYLWGQLVYSLSLPNINYILQQKYKH